MINDELLKSIPTKIPAYVFRVSDVLLSNGFEAYLVGGSVRDLLTETNPKDFDIATNATPNQVQEIFPKSVLTGAKFGTVTVIIDDESGERFDIEVTTYRSESDYFGGRWPGKVEFAKNIKDDLSRRDFTINAIAINLDNLTIDNIKEKFVDLFGGINDLKNKLIKAVGNPLERFEEDGLRPIRACRFASVLGFKIEENTFNSIKTCINIVKMVSIERVRDELEKMVKRSSKPSVGFNLLEQCGILELYIPELVKAKEIYQPEYHTDNVFDHSLKTIDIAEDSIKWAALFHDIGKINTKTEDENGTHFYGHDVVGAQMTKEIMKRLKFPTATINKTANLVRWHMFYYPSSDWRKVYKVNEIEGIEEKGKVQHGWTDAAVRRFIKNIGGEDQLDDLVKLRIADATSNPKGVFSIKEIEAFQKRVAEVRMKDMALSLSDLAIDGGKLQEMGYKPGPEFKKILEFLLDIVIENPQKNSSEELQKIVTSVFKK